MKPQEKKKARDLRAREGMSVKEIAAKLQVSPGSVSVWVRDITLTDDQHRILQERNAFHGAQNKGAKARADKARSARITHQEKGAQKILDLDPEYVAGCMLYWAEGHKDKNAVQLANSDPHMMRLFIAFLRKNFSVQDSEIKATCTFLRRSPDEEKDRRGATILGAHAVTPQSKLPPPCRQ